MTYQGSWFSRLWSWTACQVGFPCGDLPDTQPFDHITWDHLSLAYFFPKTWCSGVHPGITLTFPPSEWRKIAGTCGTFQGPILSSDMAPKLHFSIRCPAISFYIIGINRGFNIHWSAWLFQISKSPWQLPRYFSWQNFVARPRRTI